MEKLNKQAQRVMEILCFGITQVGQSKKWQNNESFMAVHVDCIATIEATGSRIMSVAHYFEQNGDLCCDPDMTFLVGKDGACFAMSFQQANPPIYQVAIEINGEQVRSNTLLQKQLTKFANQWMRNIADQQEL